MFSNYEIRKINGEDVLYIYMTYQYEFSKEFADYQENDLKILSNQFININNIPFRGDKVYFIVDGMIVKKISLVDSNLYYSPDCFTLSVQIEENAFTEISLREYLLSVLFANYSQDLGDEVLKSIGILFQTYAYKMMKKQNYIPYQSSFGVYLPYKNYSESFKNFDAIVERLNEIINQISCLYLAYKGDYILPFIHYSNSGKTLSNIKYPYLTSVKSLWDITSPTYLSIVDYDFKTLSDLFKVKLDSNSNIQILSNGSSIKFGYRTFSIYELKNLLNLNSVDISIIVNRNGIKFVCKGIGNGLGLSVYGASSIESNGGSYNHILSYYFPKCSLYKNIKELSS